MGSVGSSRVARESVVPGAGHLLLLGLALYLLQLLVTAVINLGRASCRHEILGPRWHSRLQLLQKEKRYDWFMKKFIYLWLQDFLNDCGALCSYNISQISKSHK